MDTSSTPDSYPRDLPVADPMATDATVAEDRHGLEVLTVDACYSLLSMTPIGRVAFVYKGESAILPVNFFLDGKAVVFRTGAGAKLDSAERGHPMAFEADGYDEQSKSGWSVLMRGVPEVVWSKELEERYDLSGLAPWAEHSERGSWLRLSPSSITGRRIRRR